MQETNPLLPVNLVQLSEPPLRIIGAEGDCDDVALLQWHAVFIHGLQVVEDASRNGVSQGRSLI